MTDLLGDLRYAARVLSRSPWLAGLVVVTLAVGIGANTALFSLLDSVLLKGLPYREPHRLVAVWGQDGARTGMRLPIPLFEVLRDRSRTIQGFTTHNVVGGALATREGPVRVSGQRVSPNFVELMGIPPRAGRGFRPEEGDPGAPAVMVVAHGFWQRYLEGDPQAIGTTQFIEGVPYTVVGIMPPTFRTYLGGTDFFTPYASEGVRTAWDEIGYELQARLAPGATVEDAQRELQTLATSAGIDGWGEGGRRVGVRALRAEVVGDSARALQLLMAAMAVVLIIACANLAQLLLARSDGRVREFATRRAVGAPTSRLFRLALVESLLLSSAGGIGGVVLAYWLLPLMLGLAPAEIPRIAEASIDGRVLSVALALTVLTGCVFGLAPALRLSRLSVVHALKRTPGHPSARNMPFRSVLVVGQVTSSVALLVLAGLIGQSFLTLLPSQSGFQSGSRSVSYVSLRRDRYPDRLERVVRWEELLRRVAAFPGVTGTGLGTNVPFGGGERFRAVELETGGTSFPEDLTADVRAVSPDFFRLLEMPLVRGRVFTAEDGPQSPGVAIVNLTLARKLAPGADVLGRSLSGLGGWAALPSHEIVGVVADTRSTGTTTDVWDEIYVPFAQGTGDGGYLIMRSDLDSQTLRDRLRAELRAWAPAEPASPSQAITLLDDLASRSVAGPRFSAMLISAFAGMALLLSVIGVFGLVAYSMSQRIREFGIRAALGARPRDLLSTAMRAAATLTTIGVGLGLTAAVYLTRYVESFLYSIDPLDLPTFVGAGAVMLLIAVAAACIPARRAAQVDPATALRCD